MSNDLILAARPAALAKAALTAVNVGREQNTFHPDGSVEFAFFSSRGKKRFLAQVMVDPSGAARIL